MANSRFSLLLCTVALGLPTSALADTEDEEGPDMAFLEYLGMWEESDEDWQLLNEETVAEVDERSDPAPKGEESTETDDEI